MSALTRGVHSGIALSNQIERGRREREEAPYREESRRMAIDGQRMDNEMRKHQLESYRQGAQLAKSKEHRESLKNLLVGFHTAIRGNPDIVKSPAFMESFNHVFGGAVNQGSGGARKEVSRIDFTPDGEGLMFGLDVYDEQGNVRKAPMTKNRGTAEEGDNEVHKLP